MGSNPATPTNRLREAPIAALVPMHGLPGLGVVAVLATGLGFAGVLGRRDQSPSRLQPLSATRLALRTSVITMASVLRKTVANGEIRESGRTMFGKPKFPDGSRLLDPKEDKLWLVFDGSCHHVASNDVYSRLFKDNIFIEKIDKATDINEGESLMFGTCLVRGHAGAPAFFLAVHPSKIKLHPISNMRLIEKYGFDASLCRLIPWDLMKDIPKGRPFL